MIMVAPNVFVNRNTRLHENFLNLSLAGPFTSLPVICWTFDCFLLGLQLFVRNFSEFTAMTDEVQAACISV